MTVEKSVYNFKDDGTLITMPENILIPNVKPRTGLHVKYLTPLMHYQMSSKQKPDILILGNLKDADTYSNLVKNKLNYAIKLILKLKKFTSI